MLILLRNINNIIIALILVTTITTITHARWLQPGESDLIYEYKNVDIIINNNESSVTEELLATIVTDQGKSQATAWHRDYYPSHETLEILDAYTIVGSKKYKVPNKFIEDKMLYSRGVGFDRRHCLKITFPKAEIGAKIYLKLRSNSKHLVNNHFSDIIDFTGDYMDFTSKEYKKCSCNINSSMPVYININDPSHRFKLVQINKAKSGRYLTKIKSTKSITGVSKGDDVGISCYLLDEHSKTMLSISTDSSWEDIGKKLTRDYFTVIDQPLPAKLKVIVDDAKKYTNSVEQINFVTAKLQDILSVRYIGEHPMNYVDEYRINSELIPRDLIRIVDIGADHSKDFVVAAAAVLKQLQYKVYPVLVPNHYVGDISQVKLPNMIDIHKLEYVALKVIDGNSQVYWLDPSDRVSAANSIPYCIYDRMVLVLNPHGATYEKVPEIDPEYSQVIINTVITRKSSSNFNYNGNAILKGDYAAAFTGTALREGPEFVKTVILFFISGVRLDDHNKQNIVISDLTSRIVQDYRVEYEYEDDLSTLITNLGYGLSLAKPKSVADIYERVVSTIPDQVCDLYIRLPSTIYHRMIIKDEVLKSIDKLNYKIDTPWIYIEQSCRQVGNDSEIVHKCIIRKSVISNLELKGATYKKLKKDIECIVNDAYVILGEK